jgi:hypothetical protein
MIASTTQTWQEMNWVLGINWWQDLHLTDYRTVRVVLSTHAIQGLSALDFSLAARIDKIDVAYSPKWLRENPLPSPV